MPSDADIRASSDRYLRNAIIAVLAHDRSATLWDAARLLTVGEEGYAYRSRVGARVRTLPEFSEISRFFTQELTAQLADSRSTTTAKLDAPVNKLARLLNSPSIKRVLLNESLRVDFDRVIAGREVLVVRGALGAMGAGNTSVLMQLLMGMLDAALARQQDLVPAERRVTVALKVDEAPLVLNRGFAETIALKRSAGLETVACWQTDAQWVDREIRDQLDALFAHRVYFATASARDARASAALLMAEFADAVRPGAEHLSSLGHPELRLHLPKYHALVSWSTEHGRQPAFIARTIPMRVDRRRLAAHAKRQHERGARHLADLRQPHWELDDGPGSAAGPRPGVEKPTSPRAHVLGEPPAQPAASYAELVEFDRAQRVREVRAPALTGPLEPDAVDLAVLALLDSLGHVLSSQLHRHLNDGRAATTTQRRLKRLADAGLIARLQFHRPDGGGVPMCCALTAAGRELLREREMLALALVPSAPEGPRDASENTLARASRDVHVTGWMLALARASAARSATFRDAARSVLHPPGRERDGERRRALKVHELRLPAGRTPHDFLRTNGDGSRAALQQFETVRPHGSITLPAPGRPAVGVARPAVDVLVERDDRLPRGFAAAKLERYDHFLTGWSALTARYGTRPRAEPLVVFVCRDRTRARECALHADVALVACRAYAGEYPADWQYSGRRSVVFVAERDAHEGITGGYGVPALPPRVRVEAARGDLSDATPRCEVRGISDACSPRQVP